ncbi:Zinc finger, U1-C type [Kalmanozyma brasiliensis GHG001]|uniref:Matrin-type domain-containing protein n=1 Tax=Kalmanozyma brasiliensis (strain GHG001) TaxID=1365824 RepID=V5ETM2_KALBG|nr:Zinc finger, U1-C type [Kalmanozyma brasiliensis GHG001]EST06418.1 Zinc finger, U1-C type [Kalmanozyma brasiliensis GHG001]
MADVWISRKRWTCKYCDVTINDDLPSRRHHESGGRHKQNVRQALEELYRKGEQERKDAEDTKKEMARIEVLAAESYAKDQAGGVAPVSSLPASSVASSSSKATPPARPHTGQAASARVAPRRAPEPAKEPTQPVAQPGEWEQVVQPAPSAPTSYATETTDRDRARSFRIKEKAARIDDSDDDAEANTIKIKKRPRDVSNTESGPSKVQTAAKKEEPADSVDPVKAEESASSALPADTSSTTTTISTVKKEETGEMPASLKEEGDNGGGGGLFKKRRAGAGAGAKRVRAVI